MKKELLKVKQKTDKVLSVAQRIVITSKKELVKASEILSQINLIGDSIREKKSAIIKPLNLALSEARLLFKPLEDQHKEAISIINKKIIDYDNKVEVERIKKEQQISNRVDKGTLKMETAIKKIDELDESGKQVETKNGKVRFYNKREAVIIDEEKIPREYLVPNMTKINKDALAGIKIAGVEVKVVKKIRNYRK